MLEATSEAGLEFRVGQFTRQSHALLALSVLVGLVLNAVAGWWWADTAASLVIVAYGFREGVHALRDH